MTDDYIHSYTAEEQERLVAQARFLERYTHPFVDLTGCNQVLEIGCGVGAQIAVVLRRHPHVRVTGVDIARAQLDTARGVLAAPLVAGRAALCAASGAALPFVKTASTPPTRSGCWSTSPGPSRSCARLIECCAPVDAFTAPRSSTAVFTRGRPHPPGRLLAGVQRPAAAMGGDPDVGIRLANLAMEAGFAVERLTEASPQMDSRMPAAADRAGFMVMWKTLLLSGAPALLARGLVDQAAVDAMLGDFDRLAAGPDSVFMYAARQLAARKPR